MSMLLFQYISSLLEHQITLLTCTKLQQIQYCALWAHGCVLLCGTLSQY